MTTTTIPATISPSPVEAEITRLIEVFVWLRQHTEDYREEDLTEQVFQALERRGVGRVEMAARGAWYVPEPPPCPDVSDLVEMLPAYVPEDTSDDPIVYSYW